MEQSAIKSKLIKTEKRMCYSQCMEGSIPSLISIVHEKAATVSLIFSLYEGQDICLERKRY